MAWSSHGLQPECYRSAHEEATREPAKLDAWKAKASGDASVGTYAQAAAWGDIIVLAVKGLVAEEVVAQAGPDNLANKTIIDTTNPIGSEPPDGGVIRYFTNANESLMERLQAKVPAGRFVKASDLGGAAAARPIESLCILWCIPGFLRNDWQHALRVVRPRG